MTALEALPDVLVGIWLALITDGLVTDHDARGCYVGAARAGRVGDADVGAVGDARPHDPAAAATGSNIMFQGHVASLQAEVATVEHHERPVYLDRIAVLRTGVFALDHLFRSMFTMVGWLLRLAFVVRAAGRDPSRAAPAPGQRASRCSLVAVWRPEDREAHRGGGRLARPARPPPLHRRRRRPRPARRCASPATRPTWSPAGVRRGAAGSRRSASPTWPAPPGCSLAWAVFSRRVRRRRRLGRHRARPRPGRGGARARPPAAGSRRTSAPRSASSASCAASGSTRRSDWPGSRTSPPRRTRDADQSGARPAHRRHPVRGRLVRLPRHDAAGAARTSTSRSRPAASSRSSARTAPGSRRWSSCWPGCTRRRRAAITADGVDIGRIDVEEWRDAAGRRLPGLRPPRVRRRDDRRARRRAAPIDDRAAVGAAVDRAGADTGRRRPPRRARHPARPVVGRAESTSASGSGRSSPSPAATCGPSRCC